MKIKERSDYNFLNLADEADYNLKTNDYQTTKIGNNRQLEKRY